MSTQYQSPEQKASYGIGMNMGGQLLGQSFDGLEIEVVAQGLKDAFLGRESAVSKEDIQAGFDHVTKMMKQKQQDQSKDKIETGKQYLTENEKKDEVNVTDSGLQYEILTVGTGDIPTASSTVTRSALSGGADSGCSLP